MSSKIPVLEHVPDLPTAEVLDALREAFLALAAGTARQPPQTVTLLPGGGDVIAYQAVLPGTYALKVSPYLPQPDARPVVTAWTLLLDTTTGRPALLCEAGALTVERTAATTGLAVDLLARPGAATLAIIGAGAQARAHLRYARTVRDFTSVRMYSPSLTEADGADVVLLCTSAAGPVLDAAVLAPGTLVTSISTNAPKAHEITPEALAGLEVYGDYRPTVTAAAGEMVLAAERGLWSAGDLRGDLPELLTGGCPVPSGDRPVLFRSIGLGLEDLAVARLLCHE